MSNHWGTAITGYAGSTAKKFGVGGADLGIPYDRSHFQPGRSGFVFGDAFTGDGQGSGIWLGSPILLFSPDLPDATTTFTATPGGAQATQALSYAHNADNGYGFEVTRIPNDAFVDPDGRTWLTYTSVHDWNAPDDRYGALFCGLAYSDDDGATWTDYATVWPNDGDGWSPFMMQSFAGIGNNNGDGYLYVVSKEWGRIHNRGGPILMRVPWRQIASRGAYEYWGYNGSNWQWGNPIPTPLFAGMGPIGEVSVKNLAGTWVMSYFDVGGYCISTRTAPAIDRVWTSPKRQIYGAVPWWQFWVRSFPQLYGGYIHPRSTSPTDVTLYVSQWNTTTNNPYWVMQFDGITP
ncbi:DUF4185 domain-containing protein [Nocardia anaemiae]|uniref:DUF4185 domain-containing protein n=1 Tax=Nocardia anaemiae TaxID=263910 RepID=UPI0007A4E123|nr:DUF4185 domain-containing protein [Nocardia anaemiae]